MTFLRMLLVVWVASFLVLPDCPCQLLEPLGVDFPHKHEIGSRESQDVDCSGPLCFGRPSENSGQELPLCHCQEGLGKAAEECGELKMVDGASSSLELCRDESLISLAVMMRQHARARAPTERGIAYVSTDRTLTGVYRL